MITIPQSRNRHSIAIAVVAMLALSGCGGGGGGGGGSNTRPSLASEARHADVAATAEPKVGSVTQSSDVTSDGGNPVSDDTIEVTVSGSDANARRFEINYDGITILDTEDATERSDVEYVFDEPKGTQLFERVSTTVESAVEFYRSVEAGDLETGSVAGDLFVDVYTDYEGSSDTDYLAGGLWIFIPDDATSLDDYETGVFVDGNDPFTQANIAGLTSVAQYQGPATGIYTTDDTNFFFEAAAKLTADFGNNSALGTISGQIDTVTVDGEAVAGDPVLMLGSANIGSGDSGFFTGDTSMTFDGSDFAGKWGGQFFGDGDSATDHPTSVAGTFGADGDDASLLGVFGAYLQ